MERDSLGGPDHGWYIAEPDGTTFGPFSRSEFAAQRARAGYSADALAWHIDFSEWRPLARVAVTAQSRAGEASRERAAARNENVAVQAQTRAAPSKSERKAARKAQVEQRATPSPAPRPTQKPTHDDGKRLLQGAALARAAARPPAAPAAKPVDLAALAKAGGKAPAAAAGAARFGLALRRFAARILDTFTLGLLGASVAYGLAWREFEALPAPTMALLLWLSVFAMVPLAALCLAIAGRTPGKALFGVATHASGSGGNPSFASALRREADVAWRGMGLGLPPLTLIAVVVAGAKFTNEGETAWDRNNGVAVRGGGGWVQAGLVALLAAFVLLGSDFWVSLAVKMLAL